MKAGVVTFPGSNCDRDLYAAIELTLKSKGIKPQKIWHGDSSLPSGIDFIALPGGFSYGDYLRCGAIAANSPIMREVVNFANNGGYVLGICNGFQILVEAGLVPGVLMRNANLKFACKDIYLKVENNKTSFTSQYKKKEVIRVPIAHHDGNYFVDKPTLKKLEDNEQIAFRYVDEDGKVTAKANPNGSVANIAGVLNQKKNVLGMMPHPERVAEKLVGGEDGRKLFESLLEKF